jgi:diacylglycerol diphosphate phosphatase/phosphatidate phosphatase
MRIAWAIGYAGGIPFIIICIWLAASRSSLHKSHVTLLGFFIAYVLHKTHRSFSNYVRLILSSFVTDIIKNAVGKPRPDLLSRCKPRTGTEDNKLVDFTVCTEADIHILQAGWQSFPSGHSSFSFAGLGFLALFMCGQMHVFRPGVNLIKGLLALSPLLGAAMIAISRWEDYMHDVYDVTCGAILGMAITHFSYRRYYPHLRSPNCDEPFQPKGDSDEFVKVKDDEETARGTGDFILGNIDSGDEG